MEGLSPLFKRIITTSCNQLKYKASCRPGSPLLSAYRGSLVDFKDANVSCKKNYSGPGAKNKIPKYNHGLTGKGKSASKRLKPEIFPELHGEVLFGLHPVHLALRGGGRSKFHALYIEEKYVISNAYDKAIIKTILDLVHQSSVPVHLTSKKVMDQLAGNRPHQGVCLDATQLVLPQWTRETEISRNENRLPLWLLLHGIQDPMNMGAILRTAHYLGIDKVVLPSSGSCGLSPVVSKASSGALEVMPLVKLPQDVSEIDFCQWWQSRGWEVVATALDQETCTGLKPLSLHQFTPTRPIMVIMGNEGKGLSPDLMRGCDTLLTIPSLEEYARSSLPVGSLNVSVAAGILLYWIRSSSVRER